MMSHLELQNLVMEKELDYVGNNEPTRPIFMQTDLPPDIRSKSEWKMAKSKKPNIIYGSASKPNKKVRLATINSGANDKKISNRSLVHATVFN
jgi:hypothetical protein